jgi:threonine aldolase
MIDLRSDTVTRPSPGMREAIFRASDGDQGYGADACTLELEAYCADYFGKEAALFMPSGTMSDQIALRCNTQSRDEVIIDSSYHLHFFQAEQSIDLGKVALHVCQTRDGLLTVDDVKQAINRRHRGPLFDDPTLLCLENTINARGGRIFPFHKLKSVANFAHSQGILVHLDGARLLNACVETGVSAKQYAGLADTFSICLSKGLGAPFGSMLMGTQATINKARHFRRWYGGHLHQSGFMAAAGLYALQNNIERLKEDNNKAKKLAHLLNEQKDIDLKLNEVDTNILMINTKQIGVKAADIIGACKENGVLLYPWAQYTTRAITHLNVSEEAIDVAASIMLEACQKCLRNL